MKQKYWHELSVKDRRVIIEKGMKWEKYKQPDWCKYFEALNGFIGCWSLIGLEITVSKEYCKDCDLFTNHDN